MKAGQLRIVFLLLVFSAAVQAQEPCATHVYSKAKQQTDAGERLAINRAEEFIRQVQAAPVTNRLENGIIKIPVVFHNLYHTADQKITDAQVYAQLDMLNRAFRRRNADTVNTPAVFRPLAADCMIEFHLATSDPVRRYTNGIIRKYSPVSKWTMDDRMKKSAETGSDAWDPSKYLNIWVCNLEKFAGYSTLPGSDVSLDGIVLGLGALNPSYETIIHEAGHWLGLKHIWGDEYCGDDGVSDTPKQAAYTPGCPTTIRITCGNGPAGDMYMNYMDFTAAACTNLFTQGQKQRMWASFAFGGPRHSLLESAGLDKPLIQESQPLDEGEPRWLEIRIFPNPVNSILYLDFSYDARWIGKRIYVTNVSGQQIASEVVTSKIHSLNVDKLRPGIYFLAANNDQGLSMRMKFVKL